MRFFIHNTVIVFVLLAGGTNISQAGEWPMYQGGADHSGFVPESLIPGGTTQIWSVSVQPHATSGIAISDGLVVTTPYTYFDANAPLVAQDISSGAVRWSVNFGGIYSVNQPAIDNGVIYLQTSDNWQATYLHSYRTDGTFLWRSPFGSQWENYLGPIVVDGTLYMDGGSYGGIYSFDASSGAMNWYTALPQYDAWSPTWNNGQLVIYTNELDVVDPSTGVKLATIADPNYVWRGYSPDQSPVVVDNLAYVTNGGRLVAFDLSRKRIAWTKAIGASGQVSTDGSELFVTANGSISSCDPSTGNVLWSWVPSTSGSVKSNLIVTLSHVIASDGVNTYMVNRSTHQTEMSLSVGGNMLAYGEDILVVASNTQGKVTAFDTVAEMQAACPGVVCVPPGSDGGGPMSR